ncbi:SdrD B-like domain-containing protein [Streptomyces sp. NPDC021224]|uniref:SdrD B-like domain-containing protein n=1 Tax=unclassified Streptomyces TaxID=2593676 RepID=UPI00379E5B0B
MFRSKTWLGVLGALCAAGALMPPQPATASAGEGKLTVNLFRDFAAKGDRNDAIQVPLGPGRVRLCEDRRSRTCREYPIGRDGTVTIDTTNWSRSNGQYKVELLDWPNKYDPQTGQGFLSPSLAGTGLSSHLAFVDLNDGNDATLNFGVWNPEDYCQDNPDLVTPCQQAATKPGQKTLVTFPYSSRGDTQGNQSNPRRLTSVAQTGALYGLAYRKKDRRIFSGAYAKRHTTYGPGGPGAIYVTDRDTGATTLFTTVPNAGSTPHNQGNRLDAPFAAVVGQESLGDVEISGDGSRLYVVNMKDRKLYTYDATQPTAAAPLGAPVDIPDSACANPDDWRPMGLGWRDGVLYAGGVCSAQSSQNVSDLKAVVWQFNPATGTFLGTPLVDQPLNFPRDPAVVPTPGNWNPWTRDDLTQFPVAPGTGVWAYPQPMLSDIEVERDGSLVLGFRDRTGDQHGLQIYSPNPNANPDKLETNATGGDIIKVCRDTAGDFVWEGGPGCPRSGNEFYTGDYYYTGQYHQETAQGALALPLGNGRIASTMLDPARELFAGGVGWFDRETGSRGNDPSQQGFGVVYANDGGFGKANGLGDLELLCDEPPVQIGNRVWYDDGGGTQGSQETHGIPGVTVTLRDSSGRVVAVKRTDANGEYYFDHRDGLRPETAYTLTFDKSTADVSAIPDGPLDPGELWWTREGRPGDDINSDAVPTGDDEESDTAVATVTTGPPGTVDHSIDAGLWMGT